jgi:type I restriction enzyme, S subunit
MKFRPHESKPIADDYKPSDEHYVKNGDLLFSRANTTELVGAVAYVSNCPQNILLPDKLWRFVWKDKKTVHSLFIWYQFQTRPVRREIGNRATGTSGSMKNISKAKLCGIPTIFPPFELQETFANRITEIEHMQDRLKKSLTELDALFASLQHRAFRGEL